MSNFGLKAFLFLFSLCAGYFLLKYIGSFYFNGASGYRHGNRIRIVSILKLNWIMLMIDLLIYHHLFSFFINAPSVIFKLNDNRKRLMALRLQWFCVYVAFLFFAHIAYFLYIIEAFTVFWPIYYFSELCGGVWLHLCAFSLCFNTMNCLLNFLFLRFEKFRQFVDEKIFKKYAIINMFCRNMQFQVLLTLVATFLLCITHWYSSDKVFVKNLAILLRSDNSDNLAQNHLSNELKVVVLTDLHIGACVYRKQVERIVSEVNELNADAVFIIGDAIDAPRFLIEERAHPLKYLRSKLGTFFVTGNHEYYYGDVNEWIQLFNDYGITHLHNQHIILNGVCIVGLDDISSEYSGVESHQMNVSAIGNCDKNLPTVVLEHNPAGVKKILEFAANSNRSVDLILSGHTHAGQYYLMVPFVMWFLPYFYGQYHVKTNTRLSNLSETTLFISAGTLYQGAPMKMPFMSEIWLLNLKF